MTIRHTRIKYFFVICIVAISSAHNIEAMLKLKNFLCKKSESLTKPTDINQVKISMRYNVDGTPKLSMINLKNEEIGTITFMVNHKRKNLHINTLHIDKNYRGYGLTDLAASACVDVAKNNNCTTITCCVIPFEKNTVLSDQEKEDRKQKLIKLYKKHNFELITGTSRMKRNLSIIQSKL